MSKANRFAVVYSDGSSLTDGGKRQILLGIETGVQYLVWSSGYAGSITPLLDKDGKPIVSK